MRPEQEQAFDLIFYHAHELGHMLGFCDLTEMHAEWIHNFLTMQEDYTLQGHRGSYKTTCLSIFLALVPVLWPDLTTLFFRKTSGDVEEVIRQVANIIKSGAFRKLSRMIHGREIWLVKETVNELQTNLTRTYRGTSQLVGLGIGTSITGKHADIVVTDDIVNLEDRTSKAEREKTKRAYMELENIKNPGGRFVNTGTPWHVDDAFTLMSEPDKYDYERTGLLSKEKVERLKEKMLPSLFAANYQLKHIASEDIIFSDPVVDADPAILQQAKHCHIDAAYGGEDYTAFTIARKTEGKYYVFGKLWRKGIDDCEDEIITYRKAFNAGRIYCETNADKGYLAKDLRRRGERVVEYAETTNKFFKITSYLRGVWKDVVFVSGTDDAYIQQICDYNENAEHDDAPDSLASIVRELWGKRDENRKHTDLEFL